MRKENPIFMFKTDNIMNTSLKTVAACLLAALVAGCADLTETMISDTVAADQFATVEGIDEALVGAYVPLRSYYGREPAMLMTLYGTDMFEIGQSYNPWWDTYGGGLNPNAQLEPSGVDMIWNEFYRGINNTNTVIARANSIEEIDPDFRNRKIAEARFLRAHYYFVLVQHFGPVHLTTEETTEVELEAFRAPESEIYEQIIDDLTFAMENLPVQQSEYGRPTHYAAMNHLAKVHLTIENWEEAADLAIEVIEEGPYRLLDNYADVFDPFNQRHDEVIWAVQWGNNPEVNQPDNQLQRFLGPREWLIDGLVGTDMYHTGIARFRPTQYAMTEIFGTDYRQGGLNVRNDIRYEVSFREAWPYNDAANMPPNVAVGDTGAWFTADPIINEMTDAEIAQYAADRGISVIQPMRSWNTTYFSTIQKHRYPFQRNHGRDYMYMRLGETYLIAAEALMMQGRMGEAVQYFNTLRQRAEAPGETIPLITEAELDIDMILDERGRELAGELHRWTDLKRTGKLIERAQAGNPNAAPNIQQHHILRPIPQHQIDRTQNAYEQNPGY